MTPRTEYAELVLRSKNLGGAVLLLVLSLALLLVCAGICFCTCWITCFGFWRGVIDRITERIKVPKEAPDAA